MRTGRACGARAFPRWSGVRCCWRRRALNLYTAGEETAQHLETPVERLKWVVLVGGALATAATVSIAGVIGFVGWMTPHLLRRVVGATIALMPLSALGGALLLLWADTLAHAGAPRGAARRRDYRADRRAPLFVGDAEQNAGWIIARD